MSWWDSDEGIDAITNHMLAEYTPAASDKDAVIAEHKAYDMLYADAEDLQADNAALREALEKCRETFAAYAEMHRHKLTQIMRPLERKSILSKIERNRDMADLCIDALANRGEAV